MKYKCFEYIQLEYDGTLDDFCSLGSIGWEMVFIVNDIIILKRELTDPEQIEKTRRYYKERKK